ncbi:MT-A70 family methyltransferase [Terrarubrum flagellatum]|uniref:MT-A70 family methyltransferase n=1 Tax=Terrirubrum flagellatum TaxID=2895980 RepID=UPI0031454DDE
MTNWPFGDLKPHHYRTLLIDCPWDFKGGKNGRPQHYKRMTDRELMALPIRDLCHPDGCHIFFWLTSPMAERAYDIAKQWHVRRSGRAFLWIKTHKRWSRGEQSPLFLAPDAFHISTGYTTRKNAEDCDLFTVGKPKRQAKNIRELIFAPPREHSRKPEEARRRIERYSLGPRAELFARERAEGWDAWGNETDRFREAA